MHGNVEQWCADLVQQGASGRVRRGGGWRGDAGFCRTAYRIGSSPDYHYYDLGFRLARVPVESR